ncbi:MAG: CAP domain-containing protein [Chloroflexi bacterium]|nr:CAP domain-containing protein [Chloroflexota bacterium]
MLRRWPAILTILLIALIATTIPVRADSLEAEVIALVNAERVQRGLPPLIVSPELTAAARAYAHRMAAEGFVSHTAPDGSTFITRDEAAGYRDWDYLAENLAAGQLTPEEVVAAWMASPAHRANILSPHVHEIGVGHAYQPGSYYGHYWVEEFGDRPGTRTVSLRMAANEAAVPSAGTSAAPTILTANGTSDGWQAATGHRVVGPWLSFFQRHGGLDSLGLPLSDVMSDPLDGGIQVQYFQRAVLEYHPENPPDTRIVRRLLGDLLFPGADPPVSPADAPPGPAEYFPLSPDRPTGLGHFVADYTRSGQPIYFKQFFDTHGGIEVFGYPKEEPKLRNGLWTQRFQAAVFEYHPEYDRDGTVPGTTIPLRTYRVQLALLGEQYLRTQGLPQPPP